MEDEKLDTLLNVLNHAYDEIGNEDTFLVYLDIQKIFYYLQNRLDNDNKINEFLPYYWYFDGPVSDTVQQTVYRGEEIGYLRKEPTPNGGSSFRSPTDSDAFETELFSGSTAVSDMDIEEAQQEIRHVITEDYDVFSSYNGKIVQVYEDAAFDFQRYCKQELLKPIEEFAENKPWHYSPEEIAGRLSLAESYLPLDDQFDDFNFLYAHYMDIGKQYLDSVSDELKPGASLFLRLTEDMWRLFCHQLRIVEHDPYHEQKLDDWNVEYNHHRETFISALREFEAFLDEDGEVRSEVDYTSDYRLSETSSWGQVVTALLPETVSEE